LILNVILASFYFALGYGVAYLTLPREPVRERIVEQPIVYYINETRVINNTVIYNYTIPIYQNNTVVINETRVINNTIIVVENRTCTVYVIGVPGENFNVTFTVEYLASNVTFVFAAGGGMIYIIEFWLCYNPPFNVTELWNITVDLRVRYGAWANLTVTPSREWLYGVAWCVYSLGYAKLGVADMEPCIELSMTWAEMPNPTDRIGFLLEFEYTFPR